jgi:hypothetical protein
VRAYLYKLVHGRRTANERIIVNVDVARQLYGVGYDNVIANNTIVRYVYISHQQAVAANSGGVFIQAVPRLRVTHSRMVVLSPMVTVLGSPLYFKSCGGCRYYSPRENTAVFTDTGAIHNYRIGAHPGTFANLNIFVDSNKGLNNYVIGYFGLWVYVC